MEKLVTKDDLLNKLRSYAVTPDDENIRYKNIVKNALMQSPEFLYAIHETELEAQLFTDDGKINWDEETHEPLGEWDRYFGSNANVRPFLFIPDTQTKATNFVCYQVSFTEYPKGSDGFTKLNNLTFSIFVYDNDRIDQLTGIPRHDLIASILREKFNWSSILGLQMKLKSSKESITDSKYVVRTLVFETEDTNGITYTPYGENSYIRNNDYWK